jgi:hypothetical protein
VGLPSRGASSRDEVQMGPICMTALADRFLSAVNECALLRTELLFNDVLQDKQIPLISYLIEK